MGTSPPSSSSGDNNQPGSDLKQTALSDRWMLCGISVAAVGRQQWRSSCCHTSCSYWWNYRAVHAGHLLSPSIHPLIYHPSIFFPLSLAFLASYFFFSYLPFSDALILFHMQSNLSIYTNLVSFLPSVIVIPQLPSFICATFPFIGRLERVPGDFVLEKDKL